MCSQENSKWFPLVAGLAKNYLACSGTTCAVERTFSSATDVCQPDRGGLDSSTMERAVGCREWLKAGVTPPQEFSEAAELIGKFLVRQGSNKKK